VNSIENSGVLRTPYIPVSVFFIPLEDPISLLKSSFLYIFNNSILQAVLMEELLWTGKSSQKFVLFAETQIYIMKLAGMQVQFTTARNAGM